MGGLGPRPPPGFIPPGGGVPPGGPHPPPGLWRRRDPGGGGRAVFFWGAAPPLDLDVRDRVHLELEDPVREERLVPTGLRRFEPEERSVRRRFREDEGRPA